jgi:hypothetical protein
VDNAKLLKMPAPVVAQEVAEAELDRFLDSMDLDGDTSRMDVDERKAFADLRDTLVRAIQRGTLAIDDKGQPVFTPRSGSAITFYEPTGATFMSMDAKKSGHEIAKMYAIMADMTRQSEKAFALMPQRDLKICRSIATLFLG